MTILVRDRELACRASWEDDLWEPDGHEDHVLDISISVYPPGSFRPKAPQDAEVATAPLEQVALSPDQPINPVSHRDTPARRVPARLMEKPRRLDPPMPIPGRERPTPPVLTPNEGMARITQLRSNQDQGVPYTAPHPRTNEPPKALRAEVKRFIPRVTQSPPTPPTQPLVRLDVPQICGTCRDYIPDPNGMRGRCGNPWAFARPRRVRADLLSCRTTLGSWWLPNESMWPNEKSADPVTQQPDGPNNSSRHD